VREWKRTIPCVQNWISGYILRSKCLSDRQLLAQFIRNYNQEIFPDNSELLHNPRYSVHVVETYFHSQTTPVLWVEAADAYPEPEQVNFYTPVKQPIACLWLAQDIELEKGDLKMLIQFLYVMPSHRNQGIGTALANYAEAWAKEEGFEQITLRVFVNNLPAMKLYRKLGFEDESITMTKRLTESEPSNAPD
jgi:ribosomal protein S18 acetylase RimI-like enzyme